MQWMNPNPVGAWRAKSTDGYYAIGFPFMGKYQAFHIEALWASPTPIGEGNDLDEAKQLCETHRRSAPSPTAD